MSKGCDILAIHTIRHSAMAWDTVAEVFDVEGTFEARCEETTKRSN